MNTNLGSHQSPRPRRLLVVHTAGEFLVRFNFAGTEAEATQYAFDQVTERWGLDVEAVRVATVDDIHANDGQYTDLDNDI